MWLALVAVNYREAALRGLHSAALRMQQHIVVDIIPGITPEPTARGAYKAAWRVNKLSNGAEVINTRIQAILIENGVRAENVKIGRKLIDALTEWVKLKGIGSEVRTTKSGQRKVTKPTADEAKAIAWAIAKSMQKNGIFNKGRGWGVLAKASKSAPKFIREEVQRELRKEFGK